MLKLDKNKLAGLKTFDDHLQERYGDENSPERKEFEAKAKAWYYAELLNPTLPLTTNFNEFSRVAWT